MCGPLGVTHLLLFSRSETGNTNLRVAATPRGPTMHFRVDKYALCKDVQRIQRHPRGGGKEFLTPPLLVMDGFTTPEATAKSKVPKHLESLATTVFRSLFPPINPHTTPIKTIRRVLLLKREQSCSDDGTFIINFRHFAITTRPADSSRPLRRLNAAEKLMATKTSRHGKMPNLGKLQDIADYMIGGDNGEGYMTDMTSGSEPDTDAEVEVLGASHKKISSAKARQAAAHDDDDDDKDAADDEQNVERLRVKLVELGPRMRMRLTKVEEGLCGGKIMWHEHIHKTQQQIKELDKRWEQKKQEKEARRREQKANVERKKAAKEQAKGEDGDDGDDDGDYSDMDVDDLDSEGLEGGDEILGE
ncbi:hypothetical protein CDD82_1597 [Ophiocordyceps australis]|uniref:Brix domain-containing protein n=1 Tax=Ophiocordyceps australis TaxID=1399860 RepID=A0A2C5XBC0_9HYPO|nr:hypothetical protein CDD82_1597 [Ophiocordyceps australis]